MKYLKHPPSLSKNETEGRLLSLAALFMLLYSAALTLAPATRERTWQVDFSWGHWLGFGVWLLLFAIAHRQHILRVPERDPYLLPIAAFLSGWGILTIWRLLPPFGLRQTIWLAIALLLYLIGLRLPANLRYLRQYKYLWLTAGLALTGLTLVFGTNPMGFGPRMWLGCCGIYLQPSEPLKLLLIAYLAANLSGGSSQGGGRIQLPIAFSSPRLWTLLAPTLLMTGMALALLIIQRDLGTASIFVFIYVAIVYVASARRQVLFTGAVILGLAGLVGYLLFDVVKVRVDAWINPWLDPSGRSYQIVQSLIAMANGGVFGRGPGIGSPGLVPLAHSDFIFAAVIEEMGLAGGLGLLLLLAIFAVRGIRTAINAPDPYRRFLAAGLTAYLIGQSILIIGGNLRLLPLTGVTIPFVSYGGSSLVTSFFALLFLVQVSHHEDVFGEPQAAYPLSRPHPYYHLGSLLLSGLAGAALLTGWWSVFRSPELLSRIDNPRRWVAERYVKRGALLDRNSRPIHLTAGEPGEMLRTYFYPDLGPVLGYTNPVYGVSGLEADLDPYLRGERGNPSLDVWMSHLLYGQSPPGLDLRLSLDLALQQVADASFENTPGAAVAIQADTGEILAMASHPTFNANQLETEWESLLGNPDAPLLNRATQGFYPFGATLSPFLLANLAEGSSLPAVPDGNIQLSDGTRASCALAPEGSQWGDLIKAGCQAAAARLGEAVGVEGMGILYRSLGLFSAPELRLSTVTADTDSLSTLLANNESIRPDRAGLGEGFRASPLQLAIAAASLSNLGTRPAPQFVLAIHHPESGWIPLSPLSEPEQVFSSQAAIQAIQAMKVEDLPLWQLVSVAPNGDGKWITWYVGGTLPEDSGPPIVLALVLEQQSPEEAVQAGQEILLSSLLP